MKNKFSIKMISPNNKELSVLVDLINHYEKYDYEKKSDMLRNMLENANDQYNKAIREIIDNQKKTIAVYSQDNHEAIINGKEKWALTKSEINQLKTENKRIDSLNVRLTELWAKLLLCGIEIKRVIRE